MLQCAGLMHYRGYFDGRCLMLINDNDNLNDNYFNRTQRHKDLTKIDGKPKFG